MYTGINTLIGFSISGAVAHLGERIPCTDEVAGSSPVSSTITDSREDRYLDGAHNPVLVGSTPAPATINLKIFSIHSYVSNIIFCSSPL